MVPANHPTQSLFGSKPRHFGRDAETQARDGN